MEGRGEGGREALVVVDEEGGGDTD